MEPNSKCIQTVIVRLRCGWMLNREKRKRRLQFIYDFTNNICTHTHTPPYAPQIQAIDMNSLNDCILSIAFLVHTHSISIFLHLNAFCCECDEQESTRDDCIHKKNTCNSEFLWSGWSFKCFSLPKLKLNVAKRP